MNVDAGWRDDDLALTPDKAKLAFFVALERSPVASHSDSFCLSAPVLPGGSRNDIAAHENFAFLGDAHIAARKNLANGSCAA